MELPQRPFTILISALGGEGGGVLADWIVAAATAQGFPVQSTSIPGLAQRTGATTYYIEIFPEKKDLLGDRSPVFALTPSPGNVDVMMASELLEAGRAMQNGYVSPQRTTLIASTHRVYTISERMAMGDGRLDDERLLQGAKTLAKRALLFDMAALAESSGTVISAVMFGALAGALQGAAGDHGPGALPLSRKACEDAIGRTKGAEASLKGFAASYERAAQGAQERSVSPGKRWQGKSSVRVRQKFPPETHRMLEEGVTRLTDYQDADYASLYLDRVDTILASEREGRAGAAAASLPAGVENWRLTSETGRYLALLMAYEDVIRVADLKTRRSRVERVREEVMAKPGEPVVITEVLKPGVEEIAAILPASLGRSLAGWAQRSRKSLNVSVHLKTSTVLGFLLMRSLAWLKPLRRSSLRYQETQPLLERWLAAICTAARQNLALALEIAECGRLVKGYGDTFARGRGNFVRILDTLVEGKPELGATERATAVRESREAALADPEGRTLEGSLKRRGIAPLPPKAKPLVFMKRPVR
ncbi:MAG: indolepyruvate oxidoreductase subunit beta family protein [Betaproteobacteria bacterium]|nr:indolepyruvate oxidoreductase subunit beta family protein [Betaproteobacteria bacterium]